MQMNLKENKNGKMFIVADLVSFNKLTCFMIAHLVKDKY